MKRIFAVFLLPAKKKYLMLSDAAISKIAIALSITGVLLLAFQQQPLAKTVSEAIAGEKGKQIEIRARIAWARQSGQSLVFELDDGNKITAIFSGADSMQKVLVKPNAFVSAIGIVYGKKGKENFLVQEVKAID